MRQSRKQYAPEFRREAVALAITQGHGYAEAARLLDINVSVLREAESYLKLETTLKNLDGIAAQCNDNDTAQRLQQGQGKPLINLLTKPNRAPPEHHLTKHFRLHSCLIGKYSREKEGVHY